MRTNHRQSTDFHKKMSIRYIIYEDHFSLSALRTTEQTIISHINTHNSNHYVITNQHHVRSGHYRRRPTKKQPPTCIRGAWGCAREGTRQAGTIRRHRTRTRGFTPPAKKIKSVVVDINDNEQKQASSTLKPKWSRRNRKMFKKLLKSY